MDRIVLAHSGGFATTVAIPWLAEKYRADVVAVTVDLGYTKELDAVHARALAMGAVRAHVIDACDEFARDFILRALRAGARGEGLPLSAALARPIIARHLVEIARIEGASRIAHGCALETGDAARLEHLVRALNPTIKFIALARRFPRANAIAYAKPLGLTVPASFVTRRTTDVNLWGRATESPLASSVADDASARLRALTKLPTDTPDDPALVDLDFHQGVPVSINHVEMPFVELVQSLDTIAGAHGVGRIDGREARVMYEAPAAVALYAAHAALQTAVTSAAAQELAAPIAATYVDLIQDGLWFTPARAALDDVVERLQESVTGVVRLRLHRGECQVVGCQSSSGPHDGAAVARGQEA